MLPNPAQCRPNLNGGPYGEKQGLLEVTRPAKKWFATEVFTDNSLTNSKCCDCIPFGFAAVSIKADGQIDSGCMASLVYLRQKV